MTSCFNWDSEIILEYNATHFKAYCMIIYDKIFKSGPSKICGRQRLKHFEAF